MRPMRRALVALSTAAVCLTTISVPAGAAPHSSQPTKTPIKHFVTLLQENHSFDNYFGTYPGANGIPSGVCLPKDVRVKSSGCVKPFSLGARGSESMAVNRAVFAAQYAKGAMSGFVSAYGRTASSDLAMAHYDQSDISYYWDVANKYVLFDDYFASAAGGSLWNHMYWMTATPGNPKAEKIPSGGFGGLATIFDRLQQHGTSWKVYVQNYQPADTYREGDHGRTSGPSAGIGVRAFHRQPRSRGAHRAARRLLHGSRKGCTTCGFVHRAGRTQRAPSGEGAKRRGVCSQPGHRVESQRRVAVIGVHVELRRLGRLVRPCRAPQGRRVRIRLSGARTAGEPVRETRVRQQHPTRPHVGAEVHREQLGIAALSKRDAHANNLLSAFDFAQSPRPPELLSSESLSPTVVTGHSGIIYPAYGGVALVSLAIIGAAVVTSRRRRLRKVPA